MPRWWWARTSALVASWESRADCHSIETLIPSEDFPTSGGIYSYHNATMPVVHLHNSFEAASAASPLRAVPAMLDCVRKWR
jgi:hypothetical protein